MSKLVCLVVIVNYNTDVDSFIWYNTDTDSFIWYSRLSRRFEIVPTDTDKIDFFFFFRYRTAPATALSRLYGIGRALDHISD